MVFQANRYYGAPQQAHNEHAFLTNEKRDQEVARHGDIKPDASGLTKFVRGVKYATSGGLNMLRNLITVGTAIAPVGVLSKLKLGRKVAKSVQTAKNPSVTNSTTKVFSPTFKNEYGKVLSKGDLRRRGVQLDPSTGGWSVKGKYVNPLTHNVKR